MRQAVDAFGHEYVWRARTLTERTDDELNVEWLIVKVTGIFSTLAVTLTAIGVYALLSYAITMRRKELGIRLALGAEPRRVVSFVTAGALRITVIGLAIGLLGSWFAGHAIASMIPAVQPSDPIPLTTSPIVLSLVAAVACIGPAIKAVRIDPLVTLREL